MKKTFLILALIALSVGSYAQDLPLTAGSGSPLTGNLHINKVTPGIALEGSGYGNSGSYLNMLGWANTSKNWQIGVANIGYDGLMFTPSTTAGGTTFTTPAVIINSTGNVGIGTTAPDVNFQIGNGTATNVAKIYGNPAAQLQLNANGATNWGLTSYSNGNFYLANLSTADNKITIIPSGYVGIGTESPGAKIDVVSTSAGSVTIPLMVTNVGGSTDGSGVGIGFSPFDDTGSNLTGQILSYRKGSADYPLVFKGYNSSTLQPAEWMRIATNGYVGIGTTIPDEKFTVNGNIHSTEVKVDLSVPGPDYVFESNYKLPSLNDIKTYVDKNHHLPEIPSAKEMEKNGIQLGDMNMRLLKKIEELTLYLIEKDKQLSDQSKLFDEQHKINQSLQNQIDQLSRSKYPNRI